MKFCICCEKELAPLEPRFFRAIQENGVFVRVLEFFCTPCFKVFDPISAQRMNA